MAFLPIVERELRVAARRKSTHRLRLWTVAIATAMCWLFIVIDHPARGPSDGWPFTLVTGYAFALCLLSGPFLTADCLSAEKREGTLGFLFLTDLKGYDVVFGKFFGAGLNAFYGLLTVIPVAGITLLLGGVTGGEFLRASVALINALTFSLAVGMFVSSVGRDSQRAMLATFGVVFVLTVGLPVAARSAAGTPLGSLFLCLEPFSPLSVFLRTLPASYKSGGDFWTALFLSQFMGWFFLALASWLLPRRWQEGAAPASRPFVGSRNLVRANRVAAKTERTRLLELNPVQWLVGVQPGVRRIAWGVVVIWSSIMVIAVLAGESSSMIFEIARPFGFVLKCLVAAQACRFFAEARSNGALDLLLATPLTSSEIVRGQTLALKQDFFRPIVVFLGFTLLPGVFQFFSLLARGRDPLDDDPMKLFGGFAFALRLVLGCYAAGMVGMAFSLTGKKPGFALARTILFVLILPAVLRCLDISSDLIFIAWASSKLRHDLRRPAGLQPVSSHV